MLRLGYLAGLTALPAAGIALLASMADESLLIPVLAVCEFLLFPILLLAVLESDSLIWPISAPIFSSLVRVARGWIVFYLISGLMLGGCAWITIIAFSRLGLLTPLAVGPLWAAAIFIYGRLLGRLTWLILRKSRG